MQSESVNHNQNQNQSRPDRVFNAEFWRSAMARMLVSLILLVIAQTGGVIAAAFIWKNAFEQKMALLASSDATQTKLLEQHAAVLASLSTFAPQSRVDRLEDKYGDLRSAFDRLGGRFEQFAASAQAQSAQARTQQPPR